MSDARKKAEAYRVRYEMEVFVTGSGQAKAVKFSAWAMSCLELYKKPYVKANTYSGTYLYPVKLHLIPYFGNMNLNDIRPIHIQQYINEASRKYAPETVKKDCNALKLIFDTAVDNQLCTKSPLTKSVKRPKSEGTTVKHAFTQEQYDTAYAFAKEWENGLSLMLLLETGISRSELLGLRWEDLDLEQQSIHINQGLVVYHSAEEDKLVMESNGLKNKFRQRTIPITDQELWKQLCQAPRTVSLGKRTLLTEQIFHSPEGKPYQPNNWENRVYRPFMRALHKAHPEVPMLSPHELRHTRATLWIAQGMDPYMAARLLGHSDLKMLTKIYDHTSTETLRKALVAASEARRTGKKETAL
jgi:integrase